MVELVGVEPTSFAVPFGFKQNRTRPQPQMVGTNGIEPFTTAMSKQCSTNELRARELVPGDGIEPPNVTV